MPRWLVCITLFNVCFLNLNYSKDIPFEHFVSSGKNINPYLINVVSFYLGPEDELKNTLLKNN